MPMPTPIRIDRALTRMLLRDRSNASLVFGERHAVALAKLLTIAKTHGQEIDVCVLVDRERETLVARVAGATEWACVK